MGKEEILFQHVNDPYLKVRSRVTLYLLLVSSSLPLFPVSGHYIPPALLAKAPENRTHVFMKLTDNLVFLGRREMQRRTGFLFIYIFYGEGKDAVMAHAHQ